MLGNAPTEFAVRALVSEISSPDQFETIKILFRRIEMFGLNMSLPA